MKLNLPATPRSMRPLIALLLTVAAALVGRTAEAKPIAAAARAGGWTSPEWAGNAPLDALGGSGFRISLPGARPWAAAISTADVDVDRTPILAVTVSDITPGASWVLKLGAAPYNPARPNDVTTDPAGGIAPGRFLVDLREVSAAKWHGRMSLEVRLFVASGRGSGAVNFSDVRVLPASAWHNEAQGQQPLRGDSLQISSGTLNPWLLSFVPETGMLRLHRGEHLSASGGLSISLPGFTEAVRGARGAAKLRYDPVNDSPAGSVRTVHCDTPMPSTLSVSSPAQAAPTASSLPWRDFDGR